MGYYEKGIERIWTEDADYQKIALNGILECIRNMQGEVKDNLLKYMVSDGMFYVPSDIYMSEIFGDTIMEYNNGVYIGEACKLCFRLAMPVRLLDDTVVGFIGYSNKDDFNEDNQAFVKYLYPPKYILQKSRYMYITRKELLKALDDDYICIVDGLFDQKALVANGINAVSLCGSAVTEYHKLYLNSIKHKVVIADNDSAGRKMAADLKRIWPNVVEIYQDKSKDIDSYIKTPERVIEVRNIINLMKKEGFMLSHRLKSERLGVSYGKEEAIKEVDKAEEVQ